MKEIAMLGDDKQEQVSQLSEVFTFSEQIPARVVFEFRSLFHDLCTLEHIKIILSQCDVSGVSLAEMRYVIGWFQEIMLDMELFLVKAHLTPEGLETYEDVRDWYHELIFNESHPDGFHEDFEKTFTIEMFRNHVEALLSEAESLLVDRLLSLSEIYAVRANFTGGTALTMSLSSIN